jgi:glycolate oxidase FAD binding subunit
VVKNVTGYDLCKLMAGSYGTLGAMTDVTIKTLPRAETQTTLLVPGLDGATAVRAMAQAMGSSFDVSGAAYLPTEIAGSVAGLDGGQSATLFRLEGVPPSVSHRTATLAAQLKAFGAAQALTAELSQQVWRAIRDVTPFAGGAAPVWRISTAPMQGAALAASMVETAGGSYFLDWAGGLIWLSLPSSDDAGAARLRPMVARAGGHATLIRAPAAIRAAVAVFEPQDEGVAALSRRVKESFDPKGVLNPGRMWAGI